MLVLTKPLIKKIHDHGLASYPQEGCGLLFGTSVAGENQVHSIYPVPNSWEVEEEKATRFRIDDIDLMDAEDVAAERGLDVIGVFHSHPDHPPVASAHDLSWATWPGFSYLITEVRPGKPEQSRSWLLRNDRSGFDEETIILRDVAASQITGNGTNN